MNGTRPRPPQGRRIGAGSPADEPVVPWKDGGVPNGGDAGKDGGVPNGGDAGTGAEAGMDGDPAIPPLSPAEA